jgi:hypothetical protein
MGELQVSEKKVGYIIWAAVGLGITQCSAMAALRSYVVVK